GFPSIPLLVCRARPASPAHGHVVPRRYRPRAAWPWSVCQASAKETRTDREQIANSAEAGFEVEPVEATARPPRRGRVAQQDAGAAQAVEALFRGAGAALEGFPQRVAETGVLGEGVVEAAQVLAEGASFQGRLRLDLLDAQAVAH